MPTRHNWKPAEVERRERIRAMGCICCRLNASRRLRATGLAVEIHHATDTGRQLGNAYIVPLCCWHHRGICAESMTSSGMLRTFGPALAKGSKPFHEFYGDDLSLVALTNRIDRSAA